SANIGINNANDRGGNPIGVNYAGSALDEFSQTATFYIGATPSNFANDPNVPAAIKNISYNYTGNIFIGSDGGMALGFRSYSAQTSGSIIAYNAGQVWNLRLYAPNVNVGAFDVEGDQLHLISDKLQLTGLDSSSYLTPDHLPGA